MADEIMYYGGDFPTTGGPRMRPEDMPAPDAMHLFAFTDLEESWYGMEIDKTKYRIVFEDETEDSVYLKIVKIQQEKK